MDLAALLNEKSIFDVIVTADALYVLTAPGTTLPPIYSDKRIEQVPATKLLTHPERMQILAGTSIAKEAAPLTRLFLYTYTLKGKTASEKQQIAHALSGTGGRKSLLDEHAGKRVGKGAFLIPAAAKDPIEEFLTGHEISYDVMELLQEART